jgi:hypothetical protein
MSDPKPYVYVRLPTLEPLDTDTTLTDAVGSFPMAV